MRNKPLKNAKQERKFLCSKIWKKILFVLFIFFFLLSAPLALAQKPAESDFIPIVRCGTESTPCDFCELFQIINRVIKLILYYVIPPLTVVAFIWAGIYYLFSGGKPQNISRAHQILQVTVIGILIAYSGWLIVNTILQQVVKPESGLIWWPWNRLPQCAPEGVPELPSSPPIPVVPPIPPTTPDILPSLDPSILGDNLNWRTARQELAKLGITVNRDNECGNPNDPKELKCTSLHGIPKSVITNLGLIREGCKDCRIQISGGTEKGGHSPTTNHGMGNSVIDISFDESTASNILINKEEYNIDKILCPKSKEDVEEFKKSCSAFETGTPHLHIEFKEPLI